MTGATGASTGPDVVLPLVVGLGAPDRGDDAVGVVVARGVAARCLPGVDVVVHEDPTDLVELWTGRELVVVVDAVRSGAEPGSVVLLETGAVGERLPEAAWGRTGRGGTHAFGLAAAVELARALRRLPPRVVLVGVEAISFEHGAPLSPPAAAAVPTAVDRVLAIVRETREGTSTPEAPTPPERTTTTPEGVARVPG